MKNGPSPIRSRCCRGTTASAILTLALVCCCQAPSAMADTLTEIWKIVAGTGNIENNGNTRQLTFNPISGNVIYVSRGTPALSVNRVRGSDGTVLSTMSITGISGGTIALSAISAAEDGAIYGCNVVTPISGTLPLKVYRWADESSAPTLVYSGDISGNATGRWGDTLTVRGAGASTQILVGSDQTAVGLLKTTDGTTFTGGKVTIGSGVANNYRIALAFRGAMGNFWSKTSGQTGRYVSIDTSAGTATDLGGVTLTDSTSVAALAYYAPNSYLAAVKRTGSTTPPNGKVYLYNAAASQTAPTLLTTASYSTANTESTGQASGAFGVVGGDLMLFSLVINNGIAGYKVTPAPTVSAPSSLTINANETATFSVTASGPGPLTYQWQKDGQNLTDGATGTGSTIAGATTSSLSIANVNTNDIGSYVVVVTGPGGSATSTAATLAVNQLTQTVSFGALADKTYGDLPFELTASADSGLPITFSVVNGPVTISGTTATIVGAGPVTIRASQAGNGYYAPAFVDQSFAVAPVIVVPTVTVGNKIYDGTTLAPITGRSLAGALAGDDVTLGTSGVANFEDKNIGTAKPVTITGLALSGAAAAGYVLSTTTLTASADITSRALTISATGINKAYDGTTAATVTLSHDGPSTDALTLSYTSAEFADKEVGTAKAVTVTGISVTGADLGNYTGANTTAATTADITPALLTVTGIEALDKAYDGTTTAELIVTNAVLVGVLSGEDVGLDTNNAAGSFADKIVGTEKTVTVSGLVLVGADIAHYTLTAPTTNADITPRSLTVTATGQNKVYDGTTAATVSLADDRVEGDVLGFTYTASFSDKTAAPAKPISVSDVAVTGADAANYTLASATASASADITPATLTVTGITAASRVYDATAAAAVLGTPALAGAV
ncbi:MAG TPA: YDG domain-containing protein, partial [Verrucomicrobiae bacterium]